MSLTIVSRGGWNARPPRCAVATKATETFLHHTVGYGQGGAAYMRQIQNQHMAPGWGGTPNGGCDVAYSFVIDHKTLVVYEGRGWGVRPGSQKGYNAGTWSVAVMGNFSSLVPSEVLLDTIAQLIRHGHDLGHIPLTLTGGHRDAPGQATTCPGSNLYGAMPTIRTLLASPSMSKPIESWARSAYEWAVANGIYITADLDKARETIEAQRQMVFLHRHHTRLGHGGSGGIDFGSTVKLTKP